jgi:hypothetical protein
MRLLVALALILATCVPALAQPCFIDARMTGDPQVLCPSGDGTSTLTIDLIVGALPWSVQLSDGQFQSGNTPSFNFSVTSPGTYQATAVDADGCSDTESFTVVADDSGCTPFQVLGNFGIASRGGPVSRPRSRSQTTARGPRPRARALSSRSRRARVQADDRRL